MGIVMPLNQKAYVLIIDQDRRLANVKGAILKKLLVICEWLAN
jgi:hypothetical protein